MINAAEILRERAREGGPVRVALIGTGPLSSEIAAQIASGLPGFALVVVADKSLPAARRLIAGAGMRIPRVIESAFGLRAAMTAAEPAVTTNWQLLCESPLIDAVVEVTGDRKWADEVMRSAAACGKHVVSTTNPEADEAVRKASASRIEMIRVDADAASLPAILSLDDGKAMPASESGSRLSGARP